MQELEKMGYRFRLDGERVTVRHYGIPPPEAARLLEKLDKEKVKRILKDRQNGFSEAPDGVLWAFGDDVLPTAKRIKRAMETGELWDVRVIYHRKTDSAEFHFQPEGWTVKE